MAADGRANARNGETGCENSDRMARKTNFCVMRHVLERSTQGGREDAILGTGLCVDVGDMHEEAWRRVK